MLSDAAADEKFEGYLLELSRVSPQYCQISGYTLLLPLITATILIKHPSESEVLTNQWCSLMLQGCWPRRARGFFYLTQIGRVGSVKSSRK